jgi:hypothetical protein
MAEREWTEAQVAAMDATFEAGVREAMARGCGLLLSEVTIHGNAVWLAAYPPGELDKRGVASWANAQGFTLQEGDRYLSPSEVRRAAADMHS